MESSAVQEARQAVTTPHDDKLAEVIVRIAEIREELQKQISLLEAERSQLKTQQGRIP
jgi:hypothetical protein